MKKSSTTKTIYEHVRCETKHCDNNFKLLKIPKILAGKQKCQICKYVMKTVKVNKDIEVVEKSISEESFVTKQRLTDDADVLNQRVIAPSSKSYKFRFNLDVFGKDFLEAFSIKE